MKTMAQSLATVTLEEIFHHEKRIYVDRSAKKIGGDYRLSADIYDCTHYEQLQREVLWSELHQERSYHEMIIHENCVASSYGTQEIKDFRNILKYFIQNKKEPLTTYGKNNK